MKPAYKSRTIHFNWLSGVLVHAVWPFLPEHFRHQPYAMSALAAWFTIGNIILRWLTTQPIRVQDAKSQNPS